MIFTLFDNRYDTSAKPQDKPWEDWVKILTSHVPRDDKDGEGFIPGEIPEGERRLSSAVRKLSALVLDLDHVTPEQMAEALHKLERWEYVYYTSYSSSEDKPRARIIMPLAESVTPEGYRDAWARISMHLGKINDQQVKDVGRFYYLPSCPQDAEPEAFHQKGDPFQARDLPPVPQNAGKSGSNKITLNTLKKVVKKWAASAKTDEEKKALWSSVLTGDRLAEPGERHNTLRDLTWDLCCKFPEKDPESLAAIFRDSLNNMDSPSFEAVVDMVQTGQEKVLVSQAEEATADEIALATKIKAARGDGKDTQYTEEELQKIADVQRCKVSELRQRWITYIGGSYYFLTISGYVGPYTKDMSAVADVFLSPVPGDVTAIEYVGRLATPRLRGATELLRLYGSPIKKIIASLTITGSTYDAGRQILYEATAVPEEVYTPKEHKHVHQWLTLLGGDEAEKLLDWLAVASQLSKTACGLYLWGVSGSGKTTLAKGLAQLWGNGEPTELHEAFSDFNERIARNPILLADEYIPAKWGRSQSGELRKLIGATNFTIHRKHKPTAELRGTVRVIITSNEPQMIEMNEAVGREGQLAIAKRILYIHCGQASADYLQAFTDAERDRIRGRLLAEHILWLAANRDVVRGKRLYVEGNMGPMIARLNAENKFTGLVCEWLVKWLMDPGKNKPIAKGLLQIEGGSLYVNNKAIGDNWRLYHRSAPALSTGNIGKALRAIATEEKPKQRKTGDGTRLRYWEIDTNNLLAWAEANNHAEPEDILRKLGA